jgi:hypothetical protein
MSQWVNKSMSQWVNESTNLKDESHYSHYSHESCESDREQAFTQEYISKGNSVLVPNNSRDRTHICDFNKELVKTIKRYHLIHVFSMLLQYISMFHPPFNLTLSSRDHHKNHRKNHLKNHHKIITETSLRVVKVLKYSSTKCSRRSTRFDFQCQIVPNILDQRCTWSPS